MPAPNHALLNRQLLVEHLAHRLRAMEEGGLPLEATAYRLFARRLRAALAGFPAAAMASGVREPAVAEALEDRYFCEHGRLPGPRGGWVQVAAEHALRIAAGR